MAKKEVITNQIDLTKRCNQDKVTVISNIHVFGNVGKTTETLGVINFLHAAGIYPVLISADPTSAIFREIYGSRDIDHQLHANQILGIGVAPIDLEDKDGSLADMLFDSSIAGRDVVIDTKGGVYASFLAQYNGLNQFYEAFEYTGHRFINLDCVSDLKKCFDNLDTQFAEYSQITAGTEIHLVRIFSLGMIEHQKNYDEIIEKYNAWKANHTFTNPNIHVHELEFTTSWMKPEVKEYFATKNIRQDWVKPGAIGQLKMLVPQFLSERDKAWSQLLLDDSVVQELAQLPNPLYNPSPNTPKWGKVLYGHQWNG